MSLSKKIETGRSSQYLKLLKYKDTPGNLFAKKKLKTDAFNFQTWFFCWNKLIWILSGACLQSVADTKFIVSQNSPEIWTEGQKIRFKSVSIQRQMNGILKSNQWHSVKIIWWAMSQPFNSKAPIPLEIVSSIFYMDCLQMGVFIFDQ